MAKGQYDDVRVGDLMTLDDLSYRNKLIYNENVKAIPTGGQIDGEDEYEIVPITEVLGASTSKINGKPQGTVFGADMVTASEKAFISGKWDLGLDVSGITPVINGSGYASILADESVLQVGTGTDADGSIVVTSQKRIRYEAGTPIFAKFTATFMDESLSNGNYSIGIGFGEGFSVGDNGIGMYQRRVNDVFDYGVVLVRNGVTTYYPFNGELPPDFTILNIYRIEWGYLGIAPFNLYWRDTANEKWVRLHRQTFSSDLTHVTKPDLPIGVFAQNNGNTTDVYIRNGSFQAGTIDGGAIFDPGARQQTYKRSFTGTSGTNQLIFAFRNPYPDVTMYYGIDSTLIPPARSFRNSIASQLLEVGLNALGNNKIVDTEVVIVPSSDLVGGTFTPVELGYSVLEVSEDVVPVLTNAQTVEIFSNNKDQKEDKRIFTLDLLQPGQTALFIYTTTSVNFDFTAFIKYQDLF